MASASNVGVSGKVYAKVSKFEAGVEPLNRNQAYARWSKWTKSNTKEIRIKWSYAMVGKKGVWFTDGNSTVNKSTTNISFSIPANAYAVKVEVTPIANDRMVETKDKKGNKKKVKAGVYWIADSAIKEFKVTTEAMTPPVPTVTMDGLKLTASVSNMSPDLKAAKITFQIVEDDKTVAKNITADINDSSLTASVKYDAKAGKKYKVRAKTVYEPYKDSEWSDFSANTEPLPTQVKFTSVKAISTTRVTLKWGAVPGNPQYEIEWVNRFSKFKSGDITGSATESTTSHTVDLTEGPYWFRIRAVSGNYKTAWYPSNTDNSSSWSGVAFVYIGAKPAVPTTWSELTSVKVGEHIFLHWTHNTRDNAPGYYTTVKLIFSGGGLTEPVTDTFNVNNPNYEDELHANDNWTLDINTGQPYYHGNKTSGSGSPLVTFSAGIVIEWQVMTSSWPTGTDLTSDWSVKRKVEVFSPPVLVMTVSDTTDWLWDELDFNEGTIYDTPGTPNDPTLETVTKYPIGIKLDTSPTTQNVLNYTIEVISNETFDTVNAIGEAQTVHENEIIFSKFLVSDKHIEYFTLNANNIVLNDGRSYTIRSSVTINGGLTDEATAQITIDWEDDEDLFPNASIVIDDETLTAAILPYCETQEEGTEEYDEDTSELVEGVVMSVYRRNVDGEFVEIAKGIENTKEITVPDPHPTLGYVTYRIVATVKETGRIVYRDIGYTVDQPGIVITWDEEWTYIPVGESEDAYYYDNDDVNGKMITLPYNVDVSEATNIDVNLVNYIGRKRPVSYYGTQLGETITLKTDLPIVTDYGTGLTDDDEDWAIETLALLRRLKVYTGDVYVRESSGNGYWANIKVSFDINHTALVIPVNISVTRVEGGA